MTFLIWLIASCLCAILYRLGGKGKPYNTKFRDLGCPLVGLILLLVLYGFNLSAWWTYLLAFGLSFGALTTYYDFIFGYDNFYAHGFMIGLAAFPLLWVGVPLYVLIIRTVVLCLGMGLWSKFIGNDVFEECGRGFLFIS